MQHAMITDDEPMKTTMSCHKYSSKLLEPLGGLKTETRQPSVKNPKITSCPFHKLELREISELPATRMLGSSSCRTFRGSASALLMGIGVSWREVP